MSPVRMSTTTVRSSSTRVTYSTSVTAARDRNNSPTYDVGEERRESSADLGEDGNDGDGLDGADVLFDEGVARGQNSLSKNRL